VRPLAESEFCDWPSTLRRRAGRILSDSLHRIAVSFRLLDADRRAIPDFIIAGAQRCGTTFLYSCIMSHPAARKPLRREIHFFDANFSRGIAWYRAHFPVLRESKAGAEDRFITGESSPSYIIHPLAAERMAAALPTVKLIVCLRNPVDRAWSHYWHSVKRGFETLTFEEAIEAEESRLAQVGDFTGSDPAFNFSYLKRGLYAEHLERLFRFFPRERVLVVISEKMFSSPESELHRACAFLGLDPSRARAGRPANVGRIRIPMDSTVRRRLLLRFQPHNRRLYELLGMDLGWDK